MKNKQTEKPGFPSRLLAVRWPAQQGGAELDSVLEKGVCVGGGGCSLGFSARLLARTLPEVVVHSCRLGLNPQPHHGQTRIAGPSTGPPSAILPYLFRGECPG